MNKVRVALMALVALVVSAMLLTGCGSSGNANASDLNGFDSTAKTTCLQDLSAEDAAKFSDMGKVQSTNSNDDGTADVCVMEDDGNGGYREHHYGPNDGFANYLLMSSMMNGYSNPASGLLLYGAMEGTISPWDAMILNHVMSTNSRGQMFQPYSYQNGSWAHTPNIYRPNNQYITVNQTVVYGSGTRQTTQSYNDSVTKAPAGYPKPRTFPATTDKVAKLSADNKAAPVVETGKSAKTILSRTKPQTEAPPAKKPAPPAANSPSNTGGTSKPAAPTSKPAAPPATKQAPPTAKQTPPARSAPSQRSSSPSSGKR